MEYTGDQIEMSEDCGGIDGFELTDLWMGALRGRICNDYDYLTKQCLLSETEILQHFKSTLEESMNVLQQSIGAGSHLNLEHQWQLMLLEKPFWNGPSTSKLNCHDVRGTVDTADLQTFMAPIEGYRLSAVKQYPFTAASTTSMSARYGTASDGRAIAPKSAEASSVKPRARRPTRKDRNIPSKEAILGLCLSAYAVQGLLSKAKLKSKRTNMLHQFLWLSVGLACPDTVHNLLEYLWKTGDRRNISLPESSAPVPVLLSKIEQIESNSQLLNLQRRAYLARLCENADERRGSTAQNQATLSKKRDFCERPRRRDVIDEMTNECMLDIATRDMDPKAWNEKRQRLKNCRQAGKFYQRLSSEYSYAALALLPKGICNTTLETLRDDEIDLIMLTFRDRRGFLERICNAALKAIAIPTTDQQASSAIPRELAECAGAAYDSDELVFRVKRYCRAASA